MGTFGSNDLDLSVRSVTFPNGSTLRGNMTGITASLIGPTDAGTIPITNSIDLSSRSLNSHGINFSSSTLASNCNLIRGAGVNPTRTSGWISCSGTIGATPAQCYTDYRELHTTGVAEVLGIGSFPFMDDGSSCKSMYALQAICEVDPGSTVLASTGEGEGVYPVWAKLLLNGPFTATTGMVAAAIYADVQVNVTNVVGENVANIHIHNASGPIKSMFYANYEASATWTYLFWLQDAGAPFSTGSLKDSAGNSINCDAYLACLVNTTPYYVPLYDTLN